MVTTHIYMYLISIFPFFSYRLFIGCVTSAFFEALLVFVVTLFLVVSYFTDLVVLKNNVGELFSVSTLTYK